MSIASSMMAEERTSRWLLLGSLALNLFLVSAAGALAARHYFAPPAPPPTIDRSIGARMERLAATLPPADADVLRATYRADVATVEASRDAYRKAQDDVRQTLREEPFRPDAMRAATVKTRAARQGFDEAVQDVIATAAGKMSPAGRNKLADWPPGQRTDTPR
jgi:uncharacterized membrane protein